MTVLWGKVLSALSSLRFRLLALPLLLLALLGGSVAYNSNRVIRNALHENLQSSMRQTSQILNIAISPYASNGNLGILGVFLSELLNDNQNIGLTYIAVIREDGIAQLQVGQVGKALPPPDLSSEINAAVERGVVHVRQPLLLANNEIGFLQYGLSSRVLVEAARKVSTEGRWMIGIGLFVGALLLLMLGLNLTRRIQKLVSAAEIVAFGDYSHKVAVGGQDEIALLASHFNLMARSIQLRISDIIELNQSLEMRVAQRTADLEASNHSLQETIAHLNETRDSLVRSEKLASLGALVAGIAHELNTPIGNALTVASTLQEKVKDFSTAYAQGLRRTTLEEHLQAEAFASDLIVRNLGRAAELVTSFKHVAVDQTSAQRRQFDLDEVIGEVITTLRPTLKKTHFRIGHVAAGGIVMNSYPGPIGQIITNLVNNAVMHAFEANSHGLMTIVTRQQDALVHIDFCDDGCGIPSEFLSRIFDPFFTTRMGRGGSGLGLNIVYTLIETVLHGSISVSSHAGGGTCFYITLPLAPPTVKAPA
jgi:signal transduction histidine kinase